MMPSLRLSLQLAVLLTAGLCRAAEQPAGGTRPCDNGTTMETCGLSCQYGLSVDSNGCRVCRCQSEICQDVQCPIGKICRSFHLTSSGHNVSRCIDPRLPEKCHPPVDKGPCRASISRIYYNSDSDSCQPFIYGGCQGNENNFFTLEDCETFCIPRDLPAECPPVIGCTKDCEHGYKLDDANCEICECADSAEIQPFSGACNEPLTTCLMDCEYGFKKDLRGCEICECEEKRTCGDVMCARHCEYGFKKDGNGCDICQCAESEQDCSPKQCRMYCQYGFERDESGCEICKCREQPKCPEIMCARYCEHGFVKDENGCDICQCREKPQCPEVMCARYCEHGFVKDENGCDICQCRDKPQCPEVMCARYCEHGFEKDENGCDICQCRDKPLCPEVMCARYCEHGFVKDENGCDICQCRDKPQCPEVMCARYCEHGFVKDENGCDICQCRDKPQCPEVMCARYCEHGFVKDENGCDICQCAESKQDCSPKQCRMYCPYGFEKDGSGCQICKCREKPQCPEVMCAMYCETGFQKDENGCDICKCNPASDQCSPKQCRMYCERGFAKDKSGCEICQCLPDPCMSVSCLSNEVCVAKRPDDCQNCNKMAFCVASADIKKIKVQLRFAHDKLDKVEVEALKREIRSRLSELLGTDEEYIRGLVVRCEDEDTTSVSFYVVSYGYWDLVSAYDKFQMGVKTHKPGTSFAYSDVTFVPEHRTLGVQYYEDPEITETYLDEVTSDVSTVDVGVIVGCTVAGLIGLLLVTVVIIFVVRSKKIKHDRPKVSYVRAPEPKMEKGELEKSPLA